MSHRYIQEQLCRVQALLLESISMQAILGIIIEDKYQQMISNPHTWGLLPVHTSGSGSRVRQVHRMSASFSSFFFQSHEIA
jgi:hypothetical protein